MSTLSALVSAAYAVIIFRLGSLIIYFGAPPFLFAVWVFASVAAGIAAMAVLLMRWTSVSSAPQGGGR